MLAISWLSDLGSGPINVLKARKLKSFGGNPNYSAQNVPLEQSYLVKQARLKLFGFIKRIATSDSTKKMRKQNS